MPLSLYGRVVAIVVRPCKDRHSASLHIMVANQIAYQPTISLVLSRYMYLLCSRNLVLML
jgi:hypothetical protein